MDSLNNGLVRKDILGRSYTSQQLRNVNQLGHIAPLTINKLINHNILKEHKNILFDKNNIPLIPLPPLRLITKKCTGHIHKDSPTFNLGLINARSATKNAAAIHDIILEHNLDLLAITETWFSAASPPPG